MFKAKFNVVLINSLLSSGLSGTKEFLKTVFYQERMCHAGHIIPVTSYIPHVTTLVQDAPAASVDLIGRQFCTL